MRQIADTFELADTLSGVDVLTEEYVRLLGFPKGWKLEGRALELADWAREWYAKNGKPWFYARQVDDFEISGGVIQMDGVPFVSKRFESTLEQANAHSVILVAVGAGEEAEKEAGRRWNEEKPDEYFFLEIFGSAVVEHLTTLAGARLCEWAEPSDMAVLPHYSPGYSEWDVGEQVRLLELMKRVRKEPFPSQVQVLESGMLRPRKTQLAVFGLTRHTERLQRITDLVPCESCSFGPCQYRRAPYRKSPRRFGEPLPVRAAVLTTDAEYSVNLRALKRWAEERLSMQSHQDGSIDVVFRYDGTTCTNMGRSLAFHYHVKLGSRGEGYPIREQRCTPALGDSGYESMCQYKEDPSGLMSSIESENPLCGERLDAVLAWRREPSVAGCYCESASRNYKWGLVLETIHYALVQKEFAQEKER